MFSIPLIKITVKVRLHPYFCLDFYGSAKNHGSAKMKGCPLDSLRSYWIIRLMSMIPIMSRLPYTTWPLVDDAWITVPSPTYIATWPQ